MNSKKIPRQVSVEFAKLLNEIKKIRLKLGKETLNPVPDWRITLAMFRHPQMQLIKEDIINSDLKNN